MNKKALIVVTNHSDFENSKAESTGLWLSELTHFYDEFEKAGICMDIVSPKGGKIPIDKRSLGRLVLDKAARKRYEDLDFMSLLENTKSLSGIDWNEYDILYFSGGHGAMWDFTNDDELHILIRKMYEGGKVVSAVCHGVAALQNVRLSNGEYLIKGKKGTGFPYFDETIIGVKRFVPYNLEKTLKERGMIYSKAMLPLMRHTVVDGRLITGQNPNSTTQTAQKALEVIQNL
ncbi:type 1 glutamine amidotransferase domain-containing protein [Psychromonas aquimarina]|uniref:type 1 glutamine amidotransferase domain-containing protein n=1 Tax=Psychromonas aquimarina TaxID=444919 RepID=UPI0003F81F33|nr:type 1 glutamine amidotransferase domain-containing protein [Psychromonas aquimarina]